MRGLFNSPAAGLVLWSAVLAILVAVVIYVLGKIRSASAQHEPDAHEMLAKFREQYAKGELTDAEFRTIKTTLAPRLKEEIKGKGETG